MTDYYDIDDLLSGQEIVDCTFQTDALDCAYLDPSLSNVGDEIKVGQVVRLPLWLAASLMERGDLDIRIPHYFTKRFRRMLKAGPESINLREHCAYLYEIGKQLLPLVDESNLREMEEIIRLAYSGKRYRDILSNAMTLSDEDRTELTRKLTQEEKKLYISGSLDISDMLQWKSRANDVMQCASVLSRRPKRIKR